MYSSLLQGMNVMKQKEMKNMGRDEHHRKKGRSILAQTPKHQLRNRDDVERTKEFDNIEESIKKYVKKL